MRESVDLWLGLVRLVLTANVVWDALYPNVGTSWVRIR